MTFRWRGLLKVASVLMQPAGPNEAQIRSAASRAYYAAYGEANEFCERHGLVLTSGRGGYHEQVWQFLRSGSGVHRTWELKTWKSIGDTGVAMRRYRVIADYRRAETVTADDARWMIASALRVVEQLDKLP